MLGSLTFYRRLLNDNIFSNPAFDTLGREAAGERSAQQLPTIGHAVAGIMAGATVSFVAGNYVQGL